MGQARLKQEKPAGHAGPRGHVYFCRNRCGTVVFRKNTNEVFVERANIPLWGWCDACRKAAVAAVEAAVVAAEKEKETA